MNQAHHRDEVACCTESSKLSTLVLICVEHSLYQFNKKHFSKGTGPIDIRHG
jgi:hypothetical protein